MKKRRRAIHIRVYPPRRRTGLILFGLLLAAGVLFLIFHGDRISSPDQKPAPVQQTADNAQLKDAALNNRVDQLLRVMTLQEKIGQLTQYSGGLLTGPTGELLDYPSMVRRGDVGSLFNVVGAAATNYYQHLAVENSPHHIPLLFGYDVIHGEHTIFPVPLAMASSFDPDLVRQAAHVAAAEAAADGVRWVFSPMVDIARDARWGRITEGSGEDTFLGSLMAKAWVEGYQGNSLNAPDSVAACVKHFAAYGAPNAGREYNTVDMSELTLRQDYLPPYHAAVVAGSATVMSAFNPLNGVPATANSFILTDILRNEWKFDGFVVSDYGAVRELMNHGIAASPGIAARKAITAGVDMDMQGDVYRTRLAALVESGQVSAAILDNAVRRVLRIKFALGLFDHPYTPETKDTPITAKRRALAHLAAIESVVLLKNSVTPPDTAPVLPLAKNVSSIALIGPMADSAIDMLGSWQAEGNSRDAVTLRQALQDRFKDGKTQLLYARGADMTSDSTAGFEEALAAARQASVVILALGEPAQTMSGESASRTHLDLPGAQEQLMEAVTALGKPVVLVIFSGRPLALAWAAEHVPAIIEAWYPGIEAGPAVAEILFGDINPCGKLPVTVPRSVGQEPIYYNQLPTGRPAGPGDLSHPAAGAYKYFSRYIDETNAPLFPFGFGLSYTGFSYSNLKISQSKVSLAAFPTVYVSVEVKNTGARQGTEVVQLYARSSGGSVEEPVRELKGFQRVSLNPGESKVVGFSLGHDDLSYYGLEMKRAIEPWTRYDIWAGGSSGADLGASFEVVP